MQRTLYFDYGAVLSHRPAKFRKHQLRIGPSRHLAKLQQSLSTPRISLLGNPEVSVIFDEHRLCFMRAIR